MKKILILLAIVTILSSVAFSAGTKYALALSKGVATTSTQITVTSSNVDTVVYTPDQFTANATFWILAQDSSLITDVVVIRTYAIGTNSYPTTQLASTDTITAFSAWSNKAASPTNPIGYKIGSITLAPIPQTYYIQITWGAGCGTTPNRPALVGVTRTFYK